MSFLSRLRSRIKAKVARSFDRLLERHTQRILAADHVVSDAIVRLQQDLDRAAQKISVVETNIGDLAASQLRSIDMQSEAFAISMVRVKEDRARAIDEISGINRNVVSGIERLGQSFIGNWQEIQDSLERLLGGANQQIVRNVNDRFVALQESARVQQDASTRILEMLQQLQTELRQLRDWSRDLAGPLQALQSLEVVPKNLQSLERRLQELEELPTNVKTAVAHIQELQSVPESLKLVRTQLEELLAFHHIAEHANSKLEIIEKILMTRFDRLDLSSNGHRLFIDELQRQLKGKVDNIMSQAEALRVRLEAMLQMQQEGAHDVRAHVEVHVQAVGRRIDDQAQAIVVQINQAAQSLEGNVQRWASATAARLESIEPFLNTLKVMAGDLRNLKERPATEVLQTHGHQLRSYESPPPLHPIGSWHIGTGIDNPAKLIRDRVELWDNLTEPALLTWHAGLKVVVWPGNDLSRALFITGQFEPSEMSWLSDNLDTGMTFIDVGANIGVYSLVAAKLVGEGGRVLAIEPSKREYQRLSCHVVLNNLKNIDCIELAITDVEGSATLSVATDDKGGHNTLGGFSDPTTKLLREESVSTCPLDLLVKERNVERVDLVKIDVEGAEFKVLKGMDRIVDRWRPKILFELSPKSLEAQNTSVEDLFGWFRSRNYKLLEFAETTGTPIDLQSASLQFGSANLMAVPDSNPSKASTRRTRSRSA